MARAGLGLGTSASEFLWAVGIENTFVPHTRAGHRRLDEYELLDHYRLWRQDLDLAAELGVAAIRYGIPWYRVNPRPGVFDWSWTDPVLEYLVTVKGLTPIIDLMHYGTPLWLDNHFVNASYARRVAEYARAFAERYQSLVRFYTPLNEPGVTAAYCGRDGRWPPYLSGDDGYVKVLLALARGMAQTAEALRSVRGDAVLVHVEDAGLERAAAPDLAERAAEAQSRRLLPLDLACGRVVAGHDRYDWLLEHGANEFELHELAARMPRWDVLGVNYYPWSNRRVSRRRDGAIASKSDPATAALGPVLKLIHQRFGLPVMVTETSAAGSHPARAQWMAETVAAVRAARAEGIPVLGYTWFPMFTMIEWKYRWSRRGLEDHLLHLGLWDVTPRDGRLDRDATPLVETYRDCTANPATSIGAWPFDPPGPSVTERVA
jgi:beta-glucosidase/6-phospho-beta-glucosidase/beta-galactosidase